MVREKSTWAQALDLFKKGVTFAGALDREITDLDVHNFLQADHWIDRTLESGSTNLKFKTDRDTHSYLTKRGKVSIVGRLFIEIEQNSNYIYYYVRGGI